MAGKLWRFLKLPMSPALQTHALHASCDLKISHLVHKLHIVLLLWLLNMMASVTMAASITMADSYQGYSQTHRNISGSDKHFIGNVPKGTLHTRILINQSGLCVDNKFAVIFVHSAAGNTLQRTVIRNTWGSVTKNNTGDTLLLFILGIPPGVVDSRAIKEENEVYHDIIQIDTVDVYGNLTHKSVAMLQWIVQYCSPVRFIIKTDDDTFLNTPLLLGDLQNVVHDKFLMGDIIAGARPIRDRKSKYFTSLKEFSGMMYPTYLSGAAYVISGDVVKDLLYQARNTELFWLEDVYITGLLARQAHAKLVFNGKFSIRLKKLQPCQLKRIIALHRIKPDEMINAWKLLHKLDKELC